MSALKSALKREMNKALQETVEMSYEDLKSNVGNFYDSPQGTYQRTYQLMNAPQVKEISCNGDSATGEVSIDTDSPHYDPAGRSVQTIYEYAEDGGLLGNGVFWQKTEEKIEDNLNRCFSKHFK